MIIPTNFPDPFNAIPPNCYVTKPADAQRINYYNGDELSDLTLEDQPLLVRQIDQSFYARHYFTVYQSATTAESLNYWRKVAVVANQVGSIFDPPPAEVTGNMRNVADPSETVAGYFQAINQTYARFFVLSQDLPDQLATYCDYSDERPFISYPTECINCLEVKGSTYERPVWF